MIFHVKYFLSSISKKLLSDSINFTLRHVQIRREYLFIIQHARKSLIHNKEIPWQEKPPTFYDEARWS